MVDIPRFDVLGGSGANFRNVQRVDPVGIRAEKELFSAVSRDFQIQSANFAAAQESANKAELAKRDIDIDLKAQELRERNRLNPGGFARDMENYVNATAENVPVEVRPSYLLRARQKTAAAFIQERKSFVSHELEMGRRDAAAFIEVQENRLLSYGSPKNEIELQLMNDDKVIYERFLESEVIAGNISEGEAALRKDNLNTKMQSSYLLSKMQDQDKPLDFLLKVLDGNTDDPLLSALSPDAKQAALSQGQQLFSAKQQIEQRDERLRNEYVAAQKTIHVDQIYTNPTSDTARDSLEVLRTISQTPEERSAVQKLQDFMDNAESEQYTESDPAIVYSVEKLFARGDLNQQDLDTFHGEGISTQDYNKYRARIEAERDSLVSSPTFELLRERMDVEFPSPKKIDPLTALLGGKDLEESAEDKRRLEHNERLKTQMLLDIKTKILQDQSIVSEKQLLEEGNAALVKMRQEILQSGDTIPTIPSLPKAAALQNDQAVSLTEKYRGNRKKIHDDLKKGILDEDTARAIYNLLREENGR